MATISIDPNQVLAIEEVRLREVNSIETYIKELEWLRGLIQSHIQRCEYYRNGSLCHEGFGLLHVFLQQFEEED